MTQYTFQFCTQENDQESIIDFLYALKDELFLPDKQAAQNITKLVFDKGGVVAGFHQTQLCAMLGYFLGEPDRQHANKEVAFLYVAGIAESYRLTRVFRNGLLFTLRGLQEFGVREIRLQAEAANPYTNRLYARFARPIGEGRSLRGVPVVTYGSLIDDALAYLDRRKRPFSQPQSTSPNR